MIQLPFVPTDVLHRHGGRILEITGIKHQVDRPRDGRSMDAWYFVGRVRWGDGSGDESKPSPIDAQMLCTDTEAGKADILALSSLMSDYLAKHGEWRKTKPEGWYAHRKAKATA